MDPTPADQRRPPMNDACPRGPTPAHEGGHPPPRGRTSTSTTSRAATATSSCARASAWPAGAWRCGSPATATWPTRWPRSSATTRSGLPGCGPVAFGALPFLPGAAGELVVPTVVVGKAADGTRWITSIDGAEAEPRPGRRRPDRRRPPSRIARRASTRSSSRPPSCRGRDAVRAGQLTKVVLARDVVVVADRPLDVHAILLRLRATFGSSYRYSVDGFVGASPELLVARHGDVVRSHPLAGTAARTGDPATDAQVAAAAHRLDEGPGRAPHRDRGRAGQPAALVLVPRLGGRAVDRDRRQRAAPRHPRRGAALAAPAERARARRRAPADAGPRRPPARRPRWR